MVFSAIVKLQSIDLDNISFFHIRITPAPLFIRGSLALKTGVLPFHLCIYYSTMDA